MSGLEHLRNLISRLEELEKRRCRAVYMKGFSAGIVIRTLLERFRAVEAALSGEDTSEGVCTELANFIRFLGNAHWRNGVLETDCFVTVTMDVPLLMKEVFVRYVTLCGYRDREALEVARRVLGIESVSELRRKVKKKKRRKIREEEVEASSEVDTEEVVESDVEYASEDVEVVS